MASLPWSSVLLGRGAQVIGQEEGPLEHLSPDVPAAFSSRPQGAGGI